MLKVGMKNSLSHDGQGFAGGEVICAMAARRGSCGLEIGWVSCGSSGYYLT